MTTRETFWGAVLLLLLVLGIAWAVNNARGATEAPTVVPVEGKWVITMTVDLKDGSTQVLKFGQNGEIVYFATKDECQDVLGTSPALIDAIKRVLLVAAERGVSVRGVACIQEETPL